MNKDTRMIKILIVDDVATNVNVLKFTIQDYYEQNSNKDFTIDTAVNGWEAVGMEVVNHYDIIFLDIMMPKYDGYEVLNAIRVVQKNANQPYICMVTGVADTEQIEVFKRKGANSYIVKPYANSKIIEILNSSFYKVTVKKEDTSISALANLGSEEEFINFDFIDLYS